MKRAVLALALGLALVAAPALARESRRDNPAPTPTPRSNPVRTFGPLVTPRVTLPPTDTAP